MATKEVKKAQSGKIEKPNSAVYLVLKRLIDIFGSLLGILVFIIPMALIAVAIRLDSKGPAFFKQLRMGKNCIPFTCIKFRTMSQSAPHACATAELDEAESYITRVGTFLRKFSLDEVPQLFNILKGDMSFIGPRPVIVEETELIDLREQNGVYVIKPGLSGWAQINGRDLVTIEEKVELDTYYVKNESLWFDIKIFLLSIKYAIARKDVHEGNLKDYVAPTVELDEKETVTK